MTLYRPDDRLLFNRDDEDATLICVEANEEPYVPAQTYGPPELCYPAEKAKFETWLMENPEEDDDGYDG